MKKICIILIIIFTSFQFGQERDKLKILKNIETNTKSKVTEFGLKTEILTKNKDIIKEINKIFNINISDKEGQYNLSNSKLNVDSYIYKSGGFKNLEFKINFKTEFFITDEIRSLLNVDSFYMKMEKKSKCEYNQENVISLLQSNEVKKIKMTKIEKIVSLTGYTNRYRSVSIDGEKIDLNVAISNYYNEKSLLIGSPVLLTNY